MQPRLLVCAPLRSEARALSAGLGSSTVSRTGYGPKRTARRALGLAERKFEAMAIAGLGGGITDTARSGDVVVASEIRGPSATVRCPSAPLLVSLIRRHGFTVHYGPIRTLDHVLRGSERAELARSGEVAVDMESFELARVSGNRPFTALRVIVDSAAEPLVSIATPSRALRALRRLRELAPSLEVWARAAISKRVLLPPHSFPKGGRFRDRLAPLLDSDSPERGAEASQLEQLKAVAERAELMLVLGSKHSPEAQHLATTARRCGARTHVVPEVADVDLDWLSGVTTVGVITDSAVPAVLVDQFAEVLRGLGASEVVEWPTTEDHVHFGLPKEVC